MYGLRVSNLPAFLRPWQGPTWMDMTSMVKSTGSRWAAAAWKPFFKAAPRAATVWHACLSTADLLRAVAGHQAADRERLTSFPGDQPHTGKALLLPADRVCVDMVAWEDLKAWLAACSILWQ